MTSPQNTAYLTTVDRLIARHPVDLRSAGQHRDRGLDLYLVRIVDERLRRDERIAVRLTSERRRRLVVIVDVFAPSGRT
jgi:hypothetical protein